MSDIKGFVVWEQHMAIFDKRIHLAIKYTPIWSDMVRTLHIKVLWCLTGSSILIHPTYQGFVTLIMFPEKKNCPPPKFSSLPYRRIRLLSMLWLGFSCAEDAHNVWLITMSWLWASRRRQLPHGNVTPAARLHDPHSINYLITWIWIHPYNLKWATHWPTDLCSIIKFIFSWLL